MQEATPGGDRLIMEWETITQEHHTAEDHLSSTRDEAFTRFFRSEFRNVVRTAYVVIHDAGRAEDVAQDAFAQLYVHWRRVSRYDRPEAWVRRIAIRAAVKMVKRDRMRTTLEHRAEPAPAAAMAVTMDPDLMEAIHELPPQQRAAVALFYFEDRPTSELADILGCSESTAKVHLFKARKRLATALGEEEEDDDGA
jgi:RNA polymerase sigma factor (sigma-70 family)